MSTGNKLYPPNIGSTLPSFYKNENGTVKLTVPFSMNPMVSTSEVSGLRLRLKTTITDEVIGTIDVSDATNLMLVSQGLSEATYIITSEATLARLRVGESYKVQIAYLSNLGSLGYYSTVAIAKFTSLPTIKIAELDQANINLNVEYFIGQMDTDDVTERVAKYRFYVTQDGAPIEDTGWLSHVNSDDGITTSLTSVDRFERSVELVDEQKIYRIVYQVETTSGLILTSPAYLLTKGLSVDPEAIVEIAAQNDYENGLIHVQLIVPDEARQVNNFSGDFELARADNSTNFTYWTILSRFPLSTKSTSTDIYTDFCVEAGKTYQYAIRQYNSNGVYTNRLYSNKVISYFEDMFLFDGEYQLKIRYNPKVSSFKRDVLEIKKDPIGSKYPIFFRNGTVDYKEFPLSGLLTYISDNDVYFKNVRPDKWEDSLWMTDENIAIEKNFKLLALEWLTNGEPKYFKSAPEGSYVVRLMNTTLTPNDSLGRMLHTFNCTAYEIANNDIETLKKYNLQRETDVTLTEAMQYYTVILSDSYQSMDNKLAADMAIQKAEYLMNVEGGRNYENALNEIRSKYASKIQELTRQKTIAEQNLQDYLNCDEYQNAYNTLTAAQEKVQTTLSAYNTLIEQELSEGLSRFKAADNAVQSLYEEYDKKITDLTAKYSLPNATISDILSHDNAADEWNAFLSGWNQSIAAAIAYRDEVQNQAGMNEAEAYRLNEVKIEKARLAYKAAVAELEEVEKMFEPFASRVEVYTNEVNYYTNAVEQAAIDEAAEEQAAIDNFQILRDQYMERLDRYNNNYQEEKFSYFTSQDFANGMPVYYFKAEDLMAGTVLSLKSYNDETEILIGTTGQYEINVTDPILHISFPDCPENRGIFREMLRNDMPGVMTIGSMAKYVSSFAHIADIYANTMVVDQIISDGSGKNILDDIQDIKHKISKICYMRFYRLPLIETTYDEIMTPGAESALGQHLLNEGELYYTADTKQYVMYKEIDISHMSSNCVITFGNRDTTATITGGSNVDSSLIIDLYEREEYIMTTLTDIPTSIVLGNGVGLEIVYQLLNITYQEESTDFENLKQQYLLAKKTYLMQMQRLSQVYTNSEVYYWNDTSESFTTSMMHTDGMPYYIIPPISKDDYYYNVLPAILGAKVSYENARKALCAALETVIGG